ncbi:hypothetical protein ACLBWX_11075 [Methylobacterium sp. M6A4_1b]
MAAPVPPRRPAIAHRIGRLRLGAAAVPLGSGGLHAEDMAGVVLDEFVVTAEGRPGPAPMPFGAAAPPGSTSATSTSRSTPRPSAAATRP